MADKKAVIVGEKAIALKESTYSLLDLPPQFWAATLEGVTASCRKTIEHYLANIYKMANEGAGLLLYGDQPCGKTGIAAVILKAAWSRHYYPSYFTTFSKLREGARTQGFSDEETAPMARARAARFLVLDNLRGSDLQDKMFGATAIEDMISCRQNTIVPEPPPIRKYLGRRLVTVITTRLSLAELGQHEIFESASKSGMVPIEVVGPNKHEERDAKLLSLVIAKERT